MTNVQAPNPNEGPKPRSQAEPTRGLWDLVIGRSLGFGACSLVIPIWNHPHPNPLPEYRARGRETLTRHASHLHRLPLRDRPLDGIHHALIRQTFFAGRPWRGV